MPSHPIHATFDDDYIQIVRSWLAANDIRIPANTTDEHASMWFWNIQERLVTPTPRKVHVPSDFVGPIDPAAVAGLERLRLKFEAGENVNGHLSTTTQRGDFNDMLFNHWGINHFHLGADTGGDYVERTAEILFAIVRQTDVYFVGVPAHGRGHSPWSEQRFIEIVHSTWPQLMTPIRGLRGNPNEPPPTDAEIAEARRAGMMVFITVSDGTLYFPPGGGYSTAGVGTNAVSNSDRARQSVRDYEAQARRDPESYVEAFRQRNLPVPNPIHLTLTITPQADVVAFAAGLSGVGFFLGPLMR